MRICAALCFCEGAQWIWGSCVKIVIYTPATTFCTVLAVTSALLDRFQKFWMFWKLWNFLRNFCWSDSCYNGFWGLAQWQTDCSSGEIVIITHWIMLAMAFVTRFRYDSCDISTAMIAVTRLTIRKSWLMFFGSDSIKKHDVIQWRKIQTRHDRLFCMEISSNNCKSQFYERIWSIRK